MIFELDMKKSLDSLAHPSNHLLKYGIREIVGVAEEIKKLDPSFEPVWENIGDPIAKGWKVPSFLKEIIKKEIDKQEDAVFGYSHSRGIPAVRQWVAEYAKRFSPSIELNFENITFTSGLGSAIAILYQMLAPGRRVIQPAPSYPTHSSFEAFAAGSPSIFYNLDPQNSWRPDLEHLETQIQTHPEIAAILVINPNNPTGAVYDQKTLEKMVEIAEKNNLFIISDEVYFRMVYNGHAHCQITKIAKNRAPLIVLRGLSKDIPWPGARSGWLEFHNLGIHSDFDQYVNAVKQRILLEVCSTTLPQTVLPAVYDHPKFADWNKQYNQELQTAANEIADILSEVPELLVNRANGAFYLMPVFKPGALNDRQTLPIANAKIKKFIEEKTGQPNFPLDKRFTYYLLAATGIVTVPASDFYCPQPGFRVTTLDRDPKRRKQTYQTLTKAIQTHLAS